MLSLFEISEPDLRPLYRALAKCRIGADQIPKVADRLVRPPVSIGLSASDNCETGLLVEELRSGFDPLAEALPPVPDSALPRVPDGASPLAVPTEPSWRDLAARMLRLNEGQPDPGITWEALSRAERKRAVRLSDWTTKAHGLSVTPQGRPPGIDPALVLYCARVLCEASGQPEFKFSRASGAPCGKICRALIEALPLAQSFLELRFGQPAIARDSKKNPDPRKICPEAVAEIIRVARSKPFKNLSQQLGLGPATGDIALSPALCRVAIAYTSKLR